MRTAKSLIRLGGCPGWSESSLGAQPHCWFCHEVAHMTFVKPDASTKITLCYMLILFQTISGTWYFKTIYMLKVYSVYEQNIKSESRKANYNANQCLSYDVAVIQWITSCHKNRMTTRYITLGYWRVTSWCRPWQRYVFYWNKYLLRR